MPQNFPPANDRSLSNDSADSLRPEDSAATSSLNRSAGGSGDSKDEGKDGRDVPKAE
ncbi:MAG: hypothetical protein SX243_01755 [Acidobacteriota bacterium]|nr:hypothetical protein [Acidobacteriota bacterium]